MDLNNPIPQEWTSYVTQSALNLEIVPHMLYDTASYVTAVTTDLPFFITARATEDLSDVKQQGVLPNPQSFLIQNISIFFKTIPNLAATAAAAEVTDMIALSNTGIFKLTIGTKIYGPFPLWRLPASSFVKFNPTGTFTAPILASYGQLDGPLYPLFPNLMIAPLQNFEVHLLWPAGAVTLGAPTSPLPIEVLLDGQLARAVQ
jgi:hypothetical protein